MATIVKTPAGSWKAVVRKLGWPTTAKSFRTRRDAEDWSRRTEDEMVRGIYIQRSSSDRMTVAAALDRYHQEITSTKKTTTQRGEVSKVKALMPYFGKYSMSAVTADLVATYRDKRLAEGKANNTVRLELALLSHLFTIAIKEWRLGLTYNPVANIRKPKPGEGRNRRLSPKEEQQLFNAITRHSNPMLRWIFQIALETGMRSSEIVNLTPLDIDLKKRIVYLRDTKNGNARTVPLNKTVTEVFSEALANKLRPENTELIFFGEPGRDKKRRPYEFNKVWMDIKQSLGITDLRFHDLRHEAVSRLVEAGLSDQEVSAISGHKSMQMLKRYTHLRAEDLVKRLDQIV